MNKNEKNADGKRPYVKPKVEEVRFVQDEVFQQACKTAKFAMGPGSSGCGLGWCRKTTGS